jgi:hypothetical protein
VLVLLTERVAMGGRGSPKRKKSEQRNRGTEQSICAGTKSIAIMLLPQNNLHGASSWHTKISKG